MSDATQTASVPARPSATIMLIRDGQAGLEIFMVVRNRPMDGAMGAVVFPGGKVDDEDGPANWGTLSAPAPSPELPYWTAALRETFEEAGILIARGANEPSGLVSADVAAAVVQEHREALLDRKMTFAEIVRARQLLPAMDHMVHFAHWQTPLGLPKRFDTHFFLVAAPSDQTPVHDGREMTDSFWMSPQQLVAEAASGKRTLVPATQLNLEMLSDSTNVAEAMTHARARRVMMVRPERVKTDAGWKVVIPPEAGYRTTELASSRR